MMKMTIHQFQFTPSEEERAQFFKNPTQAPDAFDTNLGQCQLCEDVVIVKTPVSSFGRLAWQRNCTCLQAALRDEGVCPTDVPWTQLTLGEAAGLIDLYQHNMA